MRDKIIFVAATVTKKEKCDGERIKSTYVYDGLCSLFDVDLINLSKNKFFGMFRFFFLLVFKRKKYKYVMISKDPHGAIIIHKVLSLLRFPMNKVVYFEIGSYLYDGILEKKIDKKLFIDDLYIVVETQIMKSELCSLSFTNVIVFPNFKKIYEIPFNEIVYPKKVLKLIFLSRIDKDKGIFDLINCLIDINSEKVLLSLDVFGRPQSNEERQLIEIASDRFDFVNYKGQMNLNSKEDYIALSHYDLHVFPTHFYAEGFPGSLIDFFISGVPTLSSNFINVTDILDEHNSILFEMNNNDDLKNKLLYIYYNQHILCDLRKNSFSEKYKYSTDQFVEFISKLFVDS